MTQLIESSSKPSSSFLPVAYPFANSEQKDLLLVLPVPFRVQGNQLLFESQACNGLEQWASEFLQIIHNLLDSPSQINQNQQDVIKAEKSLVNF